MEDSSDRAPLLPGNKRDSDINVGVQQPEVSSGNGLGTGNGASTKRRFRTIIVEPVIFLYYMAVNSSMPQLQQYLFSRFAQDGGLYDRNHTSNTSDTSVCYINASDPYFVLQQEIQATSAKWEMYFVIVTSVAAFISTILMGFLSDVIGRKYIMVLPPIGLFFRCALYMVVIQFHIDVRVLFLSAFVEGITGWFSTVNFVCFTYLADITTKESRTLRMAGMTFFYSISDACVSILSGYWIKQSGYFYPLILPLCLCLANIIYIIIAVPETLESSSSVQVRNLNPARVYRLIFGQKTSKRHIKLPALLFLALLFGLADEGHWAVETLFLLNAPLCWDSVMIGLYTTAREVIRSFSKVFSVFVLEKFMKDSYMLAVASFFYAASQVLQAFSVTTVMMFLGAYGQ